VDRHRLGTALLGSDKAQPSTREAREEFPSRENKDLGISVSDLVREGVSVVSTTWYATLVLFSGEYTSVPLRSFGARRLLFKSTVLVEGQH
jgi:hypothetical protein